MSQSLQRLTHHEAMSLEKVVGYPRHSPSEHSTHGVDRRGLLVPLVFPEDLSLYRTDARKKPLPLILVQVHKKSKTGV